MNFFEKIIAFFLSLFERKEVEEDTVSAEYEWQPAIPQEYRQQFALGPVEEIGQLFDREEEMEFIRGEYEKWKKQKRNRFCLLLSGEAGVGVTSVLKICRDQFMPDAVFLEDNIRIKEKDHLLDLLAKALGVAEGKSFEELVHKLPEEVPPVIFENVERLFLRKIGGFELLKDFLLFLQLTRHKIFWIVSINAYSRYFLDNLLNFSSNFASKMIIQPFLPGEKKGEENQEATVRKIIAQRNGDYHCIFLKPEKMPPDLRMSLDKADRRKKQELLEDHFNRNLYRFSNGNISRAILYWTESVARMGENKGKATVAVVPYQPRDAGELELDELLILEAIWQHTSLSVDDLNEIFNFPTRKSRLALGRLLKKGWIFPRQSRKDDQEYQINLLHLYSLGEAVDRTLNRKYQSK